MRHYLHHQREHRPSVTVYLVASATCIMYLEPAFAQDPAPRVTIDAGRCIELASADDRLACFDAQVKNAPSGESGSPAPVVAAVPPQVTAADARASESVGTITSLRLRAPNTYLITLDSGLVWAQRVAERYPLRVGQRVRIYPSKWGSSNRLEADGVKGFIQVELVR